MKRYKSICVIGVACIVLLFFCATIFFAYRLLSPPLQTDEELLSEYGVIDPASLNLPVEEVTFLSRKDEVTISGWWLPQEKSDRVFILVHGRSAGKKALVRYAQLFYSRGFSLLLIDLRGHGDSSSAPTTYGDRERYDVMGAVDWLSTKGIGEDDVIGIFGLSMGATAAYLAAIELNQERERLVDIIIFDSGIPDIPETITYNSRKSLGPLGAFFAPPAMAISEVIGKADFEAASPINHPADLMIPILFVMHTNDWLIPYEDQYRFFEAYTGDKFSLIFNDLGHIRGHIEKREEYEAGLGLFLSTYGL